MGNEALLREFLDLGISINRDLPLEVICIRLIGGTGCLTSNDVNLMATYGRNWKAMIAIENVSSRDPRTDLRLEELRQIVPGSDPFSFID